MSNLAVQFKILIKLEFFSHYDQLRAEEKYTTLYFPYNSYSGAYCL